MKVSIDACVACGDCVPYCPVGAISVNNDMAEINQEECVECGCCKRSAVCGTDAFIEEAHPWPRSVRAAFSAVMNEHKETRVPGRGTEEVKTNDVRGLYGNGIIGITAEMGRPGVGARFKDVQKVAQALAKAKVKFADGNPVTSLMVDRATGKLNPEILNEKVLSCMIECMIKIEDLPNAINELKKVAPQIDTIFSVDIVDRPLPDGSVPVMKVLNKLGLPYYVDGKTNLGLGRPLAKEVS